MKKYIAAMMAAALLISMLLGCSSNKFDEGDKLASPVIQSNTDEGESIDNQVVSSNVSEEIEEIVDNAATETIYLEVPNDKYNLNMSAIPYAIVNNSGEEIAVVLAPMLEKKYGDSWEAIMPIDIGFCGNPDNIGASYKDEIPLEWYKGLLTAGEYRLSFNMLKSQMDFSIEKVLSDTFILEENKSDES